MEVIVLESERDDISVCHNVIPHLPVPPLLLQAIVTLRLIVIDVMS